MHYRKKPVTIEAFHLKNCKAAQLPRWLLQRDDVYRSEDMAGNIISMTISTLERLSRKPQPLHWPCYPLLS